MNYNLKIDQSFINIKVKNDEEKTSCLFYLNNELKRYFDVELGTADNYDFMVFYDMSEFIGKTLKIESNIPLPCPVEELFIQSNEPLEMDNVYQEKLRPQFHFTSKRGWINDPNGLIYHDGQYHLFYQHNPFGWNWGNMHWGHAVSKDLFHWQELPTALYPDKMGAMYSGSAVIDKNNSSGLGTSENAPFVLLYTAEGLKAPEKADSTQCLAWSNDGGKSFTKLAANPVLPKVIEQNRDPHVFWHEASQKWIMSLYLEKINAVIHEFAIYGSGNLKDWNELDRFQMPSYECPGLVELEVENKPGTKKWVFWGAEGCYLVGDFNGQKFTPNQGTLYDGTNPIDDYGRAYAGQFFSNMPDNRIIKISWMQGGNLPGMPFNQSMTLPVEVSLQKTNLGYQLCYTPAQEIENCYADSINLEQISTQDLDQTFNNIEADLFDMTLRISIDQPIQFKIKGIELSWTPQKKYLECLGRKALLNTKCDTLNCRIIVDKTSIEIFTDNGLVYLPFGIIINSEEVPFSVYNQSAIFDISFNYLKSVWEKSRAGFLPATKVNNNKFDK